MIVGVMAVVWVGAAVLAFFKAHHEADEIFDAQLVQMADTLLALGHAEEADEVAEEMAEHAMPYALPLRYQVWTRHDRRESLVLRSPQAPLTPMATRTGFVERAVDGARWRFYGERDAAGETFVVVGQRHDTRYRVATELALQLLLPVSVGLPIMALGVWWAVGRALRPLHETARTVAAMSPTALAPVHNATTPPDEIRPLIAAIDRLTARVEAALENERRFTADAAHELRTPLAALRVQAQVAARTADAQARRRALDQVIDAVDRMTHLVEQLLTLARLEPTGAGEGFETVRLDEVVEQVGHDLRARAAQRDQHLVVEAGRASVRGNPVWLEVMVRNLVDNALKYAPDGARVQVSTHRDASQAVLRVADAGPGLAPEARERLRQRFARGHHEGVDGVGLGLSIVERVVQLQGGTIAFGEGLPNGHGHGLAVTVQLPTAPA